MILITGASGFLGRELVMAFKNQRDVVITIGRSAANSIRCDLSKEIPLLPLVNIVVHAAGKAHSIAKNPLESKVFYDINIRGTKNLLAALENSTTLDKFIFISSVSVYGLTSGSDISESMPLAASDPYGISKIEAERLITEWCTEKKISYYILRLPLVAGKLPPGNLGAMVNGIKKNRYLSIGNGSAKKSMVLAGDVAAFISTIDGPSGKYNLTDGYHPSFSELESVIAGYYRKRKPFKLPLFIAKLLGKTGDIAGRKFPLDTKKLKKIISTLTFNDLSARNLLQWKSRQVLKYWEIE